MPCTLCADAGNSSMFGGGTKDVTHGWRAVQCGTLASYICEVPADSFPCPPPSPPAPPPPLPPSPPFPPFPPNCECWPCLATLSIPSNTYSQRHAHCHVTHWAGIKLHHQMPHLPSSCTVDSPGPQRVALAATWLHHSSSLSCLPPAALRCPAVQRHLCVRRRAVLPAVHQHQVV